MDVLKCNGRIITLDAEDVNVNIPCLPKRQRMDSSAQRKLESVDRESQTEPVLLFSCARDLNRFLRLNTLLLSRCERSSQTDAGLISRCAGSQTDPETEVETKKGVDKTLPFTADDRAILRSIHRQLAATISPQPLVLPNRELPSPPVPPLCVRPSPIALKDEPSCLEVDTKLSSPGGWDEGAHPLSFSAREHSFAHDDSHESESSNGGLCTPSMSQGRPRLRTHRLFCVPNHRVVEITTFNDVRPTAANEEFRISSFVCESLLKKSCSIGNFGWRLVSTIYRTEEMRDRNYFGNRGKRPLSPRRLHAVEHAYYDYLPNEDPTLCLAEARNAINQGLRNTTHNLSDFASMSAVGLSSDLLMERRIHNQ